jgi:hypothetical protein
MKRLVLFAFVFVLASGTAFADHIYLSPNDGSGGNFGFSGWMNGHPLHLGGGTDPYSFGIFGYDPGSTVSGGALFLSGTIIWIDNVPTEVVFPGAGSFSIDSIANPFSGIVMPTDGRDSFRVPVIVSFGHTGIVFGSDLTIDVGGHARGFIAFSLGADGRYYPSPFMQAPEPGTLALVGTGMLSILGFARRRIRR